MWNEGEKGKKNKQTEQQKRCCVKRDTAVLIHFKHMCYRSWRQSDSRKRIIHLMLIYCTRGAYASRRHMDLKSSLIRTVIAMWKRFRSLWDFLELDENSSYNSYKTTVSQGHTWLLFMHRRALTCICGWHGLLCSWPLAVISMMQSCFFFLVQCSLRAWTLHAPNIDCQPCLLLIEISSHYTVESLPNLKLRNSIWIFFLQFVDAVFFFFLQIDGSLLKHRFMPIVAFSYSHFTQWNFWMTSGKLVCNHLMNS